jgi:hypothetical protein
MEKAHALFNSLNRSVFTWRRLAFIQRCNCCRFPPQKRRHKRSLYVCTMEKAHALFNSLVVEKRLKEIGLVVIDEIHMLGETKLFSNRIWDVLFLLL